MVEEEETTSDHLKAADESQTAFSPVGRANDSLAWHQRSWPMWLDSENDEFH